jgi:acyl-CoA thioester hydrolase
MPPPRLPEAPPHAFVHRFRVPASAIDTLGHAGNVSWVGWVNDVAEAHSRSAGLGPERFRDLGVLWVVRRHEIEYLAEALEGQPLEVSTWVDTWRGATCVRRTLFRREDTGAVLAHASTLWAFLSASTGRPTRIPPDIAALYGGR